MPEILAPAGNLQKLYTAFAFGADAAYIGGNDFSLRAFSDGFSLDDTRTAVGFAHERGKKIFVALNIYPSNSDFGRIRQYLSDIGKIGADGVIVSDLGVLQNALKFAPNVPVHISTQANTTNAEAVRFYKSLGVSRVVLARELTLDEITEIRNETDGIELECFVHGAMCMAYSGRCLLSNYLTGRSANKGKCVQACRWEYETGEGEEQDGGRGLTVSEDGRGTYFMNSKDLCLIEHIDKLIEAGIDSFKIEGRMKSEYYTACVVNAYRRAVDNYNNGVADFCAGLADELKKVGNRGYTTGFYFEKNAAAINEKSSKAQSQYIFAANVLGYDEGRGAIVAEQRNAFRKGDVLELVSSGENFLKAFTVSRIEDENTNGIEAASRVQQRLFIKSDIRAEKYDVLRKKKDGQ
ncbi:MAG: U32 family peptidase [Clostridiales bacterium]|jgi:putative protease|nr:U32 family peptidase [Clostridiales bacterium]